MFKEAREKRDNARKQVASDVDPGEHRKVEPDERMAQIFFR